MANEPEDPAFHPVEGEPTELTRIARAVAETAPCLAHQKKSRRLPAAFLIQAQIRTGTEADPGRFGRRPSS
jgi:hypothetical protein